MTMFCSLCRGGGEFVVTPLHNLERYVPNSRSSIYVNNSVYMSVLLLLRESIYRNVVNDEDEAG